MNTYTETSGFDADTDTASMSFWLRDAIRSLKGRDPVDALNDAEVLLVVITEHCKSLGIN